MTKVYDDVTGCCNGCHRHEARGHEPGCRYENGPPVAEEQYGFRVVCMSSVEPERISWLWPGYVPAGKLTLIDGDPGDGKSTMTLDLAARVSTGSPMPDGSAGTKGSVIVLSAEDGIADTIRPRLDAAGADVDQVFVVDEVIGSEQPRPVELPLDLPLLAHVIADRQAVLVTIDPLMAFLAGVDSHNDQSVRRALHPLAKLAESSGAAIVVVRHLNKGSGAKALYRGGGSIGIAGAARAVHVVAIDPDDESGQRRLLAPVKVNIAIKPPTMAYRLVSDERYGCARVVWDGTVAATADELVNIEPAEDRQERVTAVDFLCEALAHGERRTKDIEEEAREAHGISERTLTRARKTLGVRAHQLTTGPKGRNEWWLSLPQGATTEETTKQPQGTRAGCQGATPREWPPGTLPTPENGQHS